jgi:hypothetical protein
MRTLTIVVSAALVVGAACSNRKLVNDPGEMPGSAVIFGRITSTSGIVVPGATAIVKLYTDSVRVNTILFCSGQVLATDSQQLDAAGDYRLEMTAPAAAGRKVCVQVTGDPHGLYSDIGLQTKYAGFLTLGVAAANSAPVELQVDVRYAETP